MLGDWSFYGPRVWTGKQSKDLPWTYGEQRTGAPSEDITVQTIEKGELFG